MCAFLRRHRHASLRLLVVLAGAAAFGPLARAEDEQREFGFAVRPRPAAAEPARSGPVDPLAWEPITRSPASFGPRVQHAADAELLQAALAGRWAEAEAMLKSGRADPRSRGPLGLSNPLVPAAAAGRDAVLRLMIQRGADLDRRHDDGFTPLGAAAFNGHVSTVRILLKAGADPELWGASGQGPLHLAAAAGRVAVIDALLRAGVDPRAWNRERDNALDVAANRGQLEAMERLLAAGVDPGDSGR